MSDIRDKIAKLLSLADSTNEHEARAALLKAKELMAQYKLCPEDIKRTKKTRVIVQPVGVTCTKMTDAWAVELSAVIAANYCCKAFRRHVKRAKTVEIGFAGLEEDFAICKEVFLYACDCVRNRVKEIRKENQGKGYLPRDLREMCNGYGFGFAGGLRSAYAQQQAKHQEWGLVLVVPQEVEEATASHKPSSVYRKANVLGAGALYAGEGFQDGKAFDVSRRIAPTDSGGRPEIPEEQTSRPQFVMTAEIPKQRYEWAQRMLALEDFSEMSEERRQSLGVQEDSATELLHVRFSNGTRLVLVLCSGQNNYYTVPMVRTSGEQAYTTLTEYTSYTMQRWMNLVVQG